MCYEEKRRRRFWYATHDCVAPYVDIILHRGRFWAKSAASGSIRWCCFRSCWMVLSYMMRGRPSCLLQSAGGEANRILLASALSSMRIICPNRVSRRDWIIAVSLGCFVSLCTSSFRTNWYHLMPCRCLSGPFHRCCCSAGNWRRHCFVRPTPEDCATAVTNNNFVQCPCNSTVTVSL